VYLIVLLLVTIYICLIPNEYTMWLLQLETLPMNFRFQLLAIGVTNILLVFSFERFIILGIGKRSIRNLSPYRLKYILKQWLGFKQSENDEFRNLGNRKYNQIRRRIVLEKHGGSIDEHSYI
jgi:hypothetical protein